MNATQFLMLPHPHLVMPVRLSLTFAQILSSRKETRAVGLARK